VQCFAFHGHPLYAPIGLNTAAPQVDGVSRESIQCVFPGRRSQMPLARANACWLQARSLVEGGKAFTLVTRTLDGAASEVCLALDANSGKELWVALVGPAKYQGGGDSGAEGNSGGDGPRSTPAASGNRVYTYSPDMVLQCLDANSGKPVWAKDILKEFGGKNIGWKSAMSPVLDGGLVFIAGGGQGQSMMAFNQETGAVVWKTGDDAMTHATPVLATLLGTKQVIFMMQSGMVALEAATGRPLWRFAFPYRTSTACSPV